VVAASIHSPALRDFDENALKPCAISDRELQRECGRARLQCPWTRSVRAAGDPAKLAKTPGLNQDKSLKIEEGTDTYISSLAGYLAALADKLANPRYFPRPPRTNLAAVQAAAIASYSNLGLGLVDGGIVLHCASPTPLPVHLPQAQ
jgi:hypothetical protein